MRLKDQIQHAALEEDSKRYGTKNLQFVKVSFCTFCIEIYNVGSICSYECTTPGYDLFSSSSKSIKCLQNATWNISKPCCSRKSLSNFV